MKDKLELEPSSLLFVSISSVVLRPLIVCIWIGTSKLSVCSYTSVSV